MEAQTEIECDQREKNGAVPLGTAKESLRTQMVTLPQAET